MKITLLFPAFLIAMVMYGNAQFPDNAHRISSQFTDTIPEFSYRGMSFEEFIGMNMLYPQKMIDQGKSDRVIIDFTVRKDGSVSNVFCRDSAKHDSLFVKEALRVVRLTDGRWKSGIIKGSSADFRMRVPILFRLEE